MHDAAPARLPADLVPPADTAGAALTQAVFIGRQAGAAWQAGQAALQGGNLAQALFWMERAWRLAPDDPATALALASARLHNGEPLAALPLLERVTQRVDSREALLLLAMARHQAGQSSRAAASLAAMLASHLAPRTAELDALAGALAPAVGAPGWCGVTPEGIPIVVANAPGRVELALDGRRWQPNAGSNSATVPQEARELTATLGGRPLLGSPIDLRRARRIEGVAEARDGELEGWAWHPGNPDADPVLRVAPADGQGGFSITADDPSIAASAPLARPRRFHVPAARLAGLTRPLHILDADGRDLAGSPLDPDGALRAAVSIARAVARRFPLRGTATVGDDPLLHAAAAATLRGPTPAAPTAPDRDVAVVVPAYRGAATTNRCLTALLANIPAGTTIVVVDDASPEPDLAALLDSHRDAGHIRLLRHRTNRGFPASANAGLRLAARLAPGADLLLLNSDAIVTKGWIEGLRAAVHAAGDIGTATPLSNDATILSYPEITQANTPPEGPALAAIARLAARANAGLAVEIPTAIGFCMYLRRECLAATGLFREDVFAQGYGEENDFCIRARHLGWRHVGVPGVYVAHEGGTSFGAATSPLVARNLAVLERLHPGYADIIAAFQAENPLAEPRRRLDLLRWRAGQSRKGAAILVTHDSGGGVERVVRDRCATLRRGGLRAVVLRPVPDRQRAGAQGGRAYRTGLLRVEDGNGAAYPNLIFALPRELAALATLLRADKPSVLEIHNLLGHDHTVLRLADRLGIAEEIHLHDYAWFCPRVTLLGPERRYCGEPEDARVCEACVADAGRVSEDDIPIATLRARSARDLARARRIVAPSADSAARLRRHFPAIAPVVAPLEDDAAALAAGRALPPLPHRRGERKRVCIIGGIGAEKGYDIVLACARDAALRDLPLEFVLVGHTEDDRRLLDTGRVAVTGGYREGEGEMLVRAQRPHLAFLPSIWPETWCFTLGVAWRAGLAVAVFDIGAQAERVRATGAGRVLPLGLPAAAINNALLAM